MPKRNDALSLEGRRETPRVAALCAALADRIPCSAAARAQLRAMPFHEIVPAYVNYALRLVPPRPRQVLELDGFSEHRRSVDQERLVNVLLEIKNGDDISARLSDRVRTHGFAPTVVRNIARRQWEDKDLALNAWGIHHLHLGPRSRVGKVRRGDELLYCHIRRDRVLLVGCGSHRHFSEEIVRMGSRLRAATGYVLKGLDPSTNFSHREQLQLARAGASTVDVLDGQVVVGGLLVMNGYGVRTMRHANEICFSIGRVEEGLDDPKFVADLLNLPASEIPPEPQFSWDLEYTDLVLHEHVTGGKHLILTGPL